MAETLKRRMISDATHSYEGRMLRPNDEFECTHAEGEDLKALNFAHDAEEQPKRRGRPPGTYKRRDMSAEE